ncbi:MAG: DUF1902 domain-containing protein [Acidobacteriota bacterium]
MNAEWDDEARVWVATSAEVPGLATEADDMEALVEKLKKMIPELLDANGVAHGERRAFRDPRKALRGGSPRSSLTA